MLHFRSGSLGANAVFCREGNEVLTCFPPFRKQQSLASMEERMNPGQLDSDKDRLLLIQDKEQLLRELRAITPRSR